MKSSAGELRKDFPIFGLGGDFHDIAYLDSAATANKPQVVIDAVSKFYAFHNSSVHRGIYQAAEAITGQFEVVRAKIAKFLGAKSHEIIFTSGATEGVNFIADTWGMANLGPEDEILVSELEHHSNLLPWLRLAEKTGAKIVFIPIDKRLLQLKFNESLVTKCTKLVAVTHDSNVLSDVWVRGSLERLIRSAHDVGAKVFLDGAQSVAHQKIDLMALDVDFFVFSGHKILAPTGVGVLFIKSDLQDEVPPYRVGGGMVQFALPGKLKWHNAPQKFEAGTPPIAQVVGLGAAIDYISKNIDFGWLQDHESMLCEEVATFLHGMPGVKVLGYDGPRCLCRHVVSFTVKNVHSHDVAGFLGERGVAVRGGHHCAQLLHEVLGLESTVRLSVFCYNTPDDVVRFKEAFSEAVSFFAR